MAALVSLMVAMPLMAQPAASARGGVASVDTRMVEVAGHAMRVQTAGWHHRNEGRPVVVLVNGAGTPVETWKPILAAVADFAPVVAYDRSGIGQSPWDGASPTPDHVNDRLRALLEQLGAEPPYVLVGLASGGPLIQHFATRWPGQVGGLVFIDAPHLRWRMEAELARLARHGASAEDTAAISGHLKQMMAGLPAGHQAEMQEVYAAVRNGSAWPPAPPAQIPMAILLAGWRSPPGHELTIPFDDAAYWQALQREGVARYLASLPGDIQAKLTAESEIRRDVMGDDPEVVIDAIRRVHAAVGTREVRDKAPTSPAPAVDLPYEERTIEVNGVALRYLDFGGDGIPVVFTPAMSRSVKEYVDIGTRLSRDYRVLVVGRRDEGGPIQWIGTRGHAEDLLGFLDALHINKAVLAGNTDPSYRMTYLAEEHPERVAGVIYLAGPPAVDDIARDPASGYPMLMRVWGVNDGYVDEESHPFRYRNDETAAIDVPALTFVIPDGTRGLDDLAIPLLMVGSPLVADAVARMAKELGDLDPDISYFARLQTEADFRDQRLAAIRDPEARVYFQRLASDAAMQREHARYWADRFVPVERENWASFRRAFGERLRVVVLDVPTITGYEYRTWPALIEPHVRRFLNDVGARR